MAGAVGHSPLVDDGEGGDDCVDEVDPDQDTGFVALGQEGEQGAADDAGNGAEDVPGPAVGGFADAEANEEGEEDANDAPWGVEEGGDGACEAEAGD